MNFEKNQTTPEMPHNNNFIETAVQKVKENFEKLPMDKSVKIIREVVTEDDIKYYSSRYYYMIQESCPADDYMNATAMADRDLSENDGLVDYIKNKLILSNQDVKFWQRIEQLMNE